MMWAVVLLICQNGPPNYLTMMKKYILLFAAALMTFSASAQTVEESKNYDNIYVGINGGVAVKATGVKWAENLDPNFGLRIAPTTTSMSLPTR